MTRARLDAARCWQALDLLADLGLIEVGGNRARVVDLESYDRQGISRLCQQARERVLEAC